MTCWAKGLGRVGGGMWRCRLPGRSENYVGRVAAALKARGVRCFYDADEQVRLWGTNLAEELPWIYAQESAAVVVFVSADYAGAGWTRLERRAAFSRAVVEAGVYVLPARFDDSQLPGLLPDVVSVDLRQYTPEQFAELVAAKLADLAGSLPGRQRSQTSPPTAGRPLEEVTDPFALEVHRPVQPENPPPGLPDLPTYVPREHDAELSYVVRAAAEGRSGIAVLVGGSSTGKTRACWEALRLLRDRPEGWRLWHPIDPSRPDAALRELPGIGSRTVVWLNEAQFYLDVADGLGERVAAGLRELLRNPGRAPVLVLATLWPQFWDALTVRLSGGADPHAQVRELLAGRDITVPAAFTAAQLQRLSEVGDARLAQAAVRAQDAQVIQFLAGAPELLARYNNAPPAAMALIHAAMDARRLGMGPALPCAFLEEAAPGYLTDSEWDALGEDWLEQALAYTTVPCKGVRGPLTRIRPRPPRSRVTGPASSWDEDVQLADGQDSLPAGPPYRLADYLDQYGRRTRRDRIPPEAFWAAAANFASPGDQARLGDAAHARGLYRDAAQLHKNAAGRGNLRAVSYLSDPPHYLGADVRPLNWAVGHVSLENPAVVADLLDKLQMAGAEGQVTALLSRDPAGHVPSENLSATAGLLARLRRAGAEDQVTTLTSRAVAQVEIENPAAVSELLRSLRMVGTEDQVIALLRRDPAAHVVLDAPGAVAWLLDSLRGVGAEDQVMTLLRRDPAGHVVLDDPTAVSDLLRSLRGVRAEDQVMTLLRRDPAGHVVLDDPTAVSELLRNLRMVGAEEQVSTLANRAATHIPVDNPYVVADLLGRLQAVGAEDQVSTLLRRDPAAYVPLDNLVVLIKLLGRLREAGAEDQVTALARRIAAHVSLDNPWAVADLLDRLRRTGAEDQVTGLARRIAAHVSLDNPVAVAWLLGRLRAAGAEKQFTALADRAAAHVPLDDAYGVPRLLGRLWAVGAEKQFTALADRAAAHIPLDNPHAVAGLLDNLKEAGAEEQATVLLRRDPAAHVSLDDPYAVVRLLGRLQAVGAEEQATVLLRRDPAAHVSLDDPYAVVRLLGRLQAVGAEEQFTALADRAATHVSLNNPRAVATLLNSMRAAGAKEQVTALANRLPAAGLFELFFKQEGRQHQFRFGRKADGNPAEPWGWEDLE